MKFIKYSLLIAIIILCTKLKILSIYPVSNLVQGLKYTTTKLDINKSINIYYYTPKGNKKRMFVKIILHGASCNDDYIKAWVANAQKYNLILIAPEFSKDEFTGSEYLQKMFTNSEGKINEHEKNLFFELDKIFKFANYTFNLNKNNYNLNGDIAGRQFVHRFLQFYNSPYALKSIAANSGWYTYPDDKNRYSYGIGNLTIEQKGLKNTYLKKDMYILSRAADTLSTNNLRITKEADAQGLNRLERGNNYYILNKMEAAKENVNFNWNHGYLKDAGHDHVMISNASADIFYSQKRR